MNEMVAIAKNDFWIFTLGFLAQFIFGIRILIQWRQTELAGESSSSSIFWWLSLLASTLFMLYGIIRNDLVIVAGQMVVYPIYLRNIQILNNWMYTRNWTMYLIYFIPLVLIVYIAPSMVLADVMDGNIYSSALFFVGITGQLLMSLRFIFQIYETEKKRVSVLPESFWLLSILGSVLLLLYAGGKKDPVLFIAQALALLPYGRNIFFSRRIGVERTTESVR